MKPLEKKIEVLISSLGSNPRFLGYLHITITFVVILVKYWTKPPGGLPNLLDNTATNFKVESSKTFQTRFPKKFDLKEILKAKKDLLPSLALLDRLCWELMLEALTSFLELLFLNVARLSAGITNYIYNVFLNKGLGFTK